MKYLGDIDLNKIINILFALLIILMILATPVILSIIDTKRSSIGYSGADKISVGQSQEFQFDSQSAPFVIEFLHPTVYENAIWKEIISVSSEFVGVGLNISIRENSLNSIEYYLSRNGDALFFDVYEDFHILGPGDMLVLTIEANNDCINCASFTFYDIWGYYGTDGSLTAKFEIQVVDWGNNLFSLIITWVLLSIIIGIIWSLTNKTLLRKEIMY